MKTEIVQNSKIAARAYQGDAMTLLVFDLLTESAKQDFVGFTIEFKNETMPAFKALNNRIGFTAEQKTHPSTEAPFQKFRWLHVLRNFGKNNETPFFGNYQYRITPRYFTAGQLVAFNSNDSVTLTINVAPFKKGETQISFTRGFLVSQAYTDRFGPNGNIRPKAAEVIFEPKNTLNDIFTKPQLPADFPTTITPYNYEEQYAWMGFNARKAIMDFINEVVNDADKKLDVLAYDFSEPTIAQIFVNLSKQGRIRMFLDNHDKSKADEDMSKKNDPVFKQQFVNQYNQVKSLLVQHHFTRLAHCKILIQRDKHDKVIKVLTGSTNFTANGININANHILILTQPKALELYEQLFEESLLESPQKKFKDSTLAQGMNKINDTMSVSFSPHTEVVAKAILGIVNDKILSAKKSVFFAVMELSSTGSVTETLRNIHLNPSILTMGITDLKSGDGDIKVKLYEPKSTKGILINGKQSPKIMPPPFAEEVGIGLGHQVHHKFVVIDFNTPNAAVFCGSSNLAQGGEESNGDNLLLISDPDIVAVFAIEAIRLIDHYQFRNRQAVSNDGSPLILKTDNLWYQKYFDPTDLYFLDKKVFMS